jgi:hypothetical protein
VWRNTSKAVLEIALYLPGIGLALNQNPWHNEQQHLAYVSSCRRVQSQKLIQVIILEVIQGKGHVLSQKGLHQVLD